MPPDVISTDLHQMSRHASAVISNDAVASPVIRLREGQSEPLDLPLCMSKFLALGLSLSNVVAATTERPASVLGAGNDLGTLRPGAKGDVGLFELVDGNFLYRDVFGGSHFGRQRLRNLQTFVGGRLLRGGTEVDTPPWVERAAPDTVLG
jgi:dihydroorotase